MDKTILKKFAIESRQELMQKIESKIKLFYVDEIFSKQQNGDVYALLNDKHTLSLSKEEYDKRELLIKRINELGLEQVIEEAAYTWFNRIVAIRYMEINDYLPLTKDNQSLGIRVLSSKDNSPDPEIMKFTNLTNPDLDIDFRKEKYIELKDDNEKYKYILLLICKKLGRVIPQIFDGITDYIDLLIPDNLLNDSGFISKIITDVPENNYKQVEIIGWLYQYYISEKKDIVFSNLKKNIKISKENVPAATQLFTPDWIVKYMVENSLGYIWKKGHPNDIKELDLKYYLEEEKQDEIINNEFIDLNDEYKSLKIEEIKFIDPCCGSGHILVYAIDVLMKIYLLKGYTKTNALKSIINNNIFGLDIDNRAAQLACFEIMMKACQYDKKIFNECCVPNVYSIQESNSITQDIKDYFSNGNEKLKDELDKLILSLYDAREFGSILEMEKIDFELICNRLKDIENEYNIFSIGIKRELKPLIKIGKVLSNKYHVVCTNPPYMGSSGMSNKLVKYVKNRYPDTWNDMSTICMEKFVEMCYPYGVMAMINIPSWMFISSYENFRKYLINNHMIINMLHFARGVFGSDFGTTGFVISKNKINGYNARYKRLFKTQGTVDSVEEKEKMFFENDNFFIKDIDEFKKIPGNTIAYWISTKKLNIYETTDLLEKTSPPRTGMMTTDNNRFLRFWWEVSNNNIGLNITGIKESIESNKRWFPYNKGGDFRRWYGNRERVVNWKNNGEDIYNNGMTSFRGKDYYFKEGITWSIFGFNNFAARYTPTGSIFDIGGTSTFPQKELIYYILGLLNSKITFEYISIVNPTVNIQNGDVKRIPLIVNDSKKERVNYLTKECVKISKYDWDLFEQSFDFRYNPLINISKDLWDVTAIGATMNYYYGKKIEVSSPLELSWYLYNGQCNEQFKKLKENEEELNRIFIDIYGLQDELTPEVEDKDVTIRKADKVRDIKALISYAVGCMFGRYSLDEAGLIYAGGTFDESKYKTFKVDTDNIIPITDEAYFEDDIVARFKKFIEVAYGKESLNANLDFIAETLGKKGTETSEDTIRRYFLNDFYSDHIRMYQKKPIYWLFDSGKKNGFKALIYMHRYNENTVPKVRLDYLHRVQNTYDKLLTDINYKLTTELSVSDKKIAQNRQADLNAKLQEIKEYDEKIAHIANQRISIDLDDGVTANYSKFADILGKIK